MAAASYYDAPGGMQAQPHFPPTNTHVEGYGQSPGLGQETPSEQRGYPQQTYNGQNSASYGGHGQQMMGQQETEHQHMGQNQMGFGNDPQGALEPQMNGGGIQQAAQPDNRDTLTKCNDNPPDYMIEIDRYLLHFPQENHRCLN